MTDFTKKFTELSKLIKSWEVIQVSSKGELDLLTEKILNNLYAGQTVIKIKRIIESELCVTYGLFKTEFNAEKLSQEIMNWWEK